MPDPVIDLAGKVALVTGAARGQGAAEAALFTELGAAVVVTDVLDEQGQQLADRLGDHVSFHHHDISSEADWARIYGVVQHDYGHLDVLVNNAGIYRTGDVLAATETELRAIFDVNLLGPILGIRTMTPLMPRGSAIVNVASISGLRGHGGALAYASSKWGLRGASRSAARELAPRGIRVNCVCPGSVDTPMIADIGWDLSHLPIPRRGTPEEVAAMVAFLASDAGSYCTGGDFVVDGGATA